MGNVQGIMTRDFISRKTHNWPLLSAAEMADILQQTAFLRNKHSSELAEFQMQNCMARSLYPMEDNMGSWRQVENDAHDNLQEYFDCSLDLLKHFEGKIVAAGGAVFKALYGERGSDIDFFFVDPEVEHLDAKSAQLKYDDLLAEVVSWLSARWLGGERKLPDYWGPGVMEGGPAVSNVYILRSEFVTTVHLVSTYFDDIKYQFIHRIYPSIGSILGGFDLGPAMVATDGYRIMATELGAYSALGHIIAVDTSRRSTSFEYRLKKYAKYCHILLPGLTPKTAKLEGVIKRLPAEKVLRKLESTVSKEGFIAACSEFKHEDPISLENNRPILDSSSFVPREKLDDPSHVLNLLSKLAASRGYDIEDISATNLVPNRKARRVEDLIELLESMATSKGYRLNVKLLAAHMFAKQTSNDLAALYQYVERMVLSEKRFVLRMPCVSINLEAFNPGVVNYLDDPYRRWNWVISGPGDDHIAKKSDYGDNPIWPMLTVSTNITMLLGGNLSSVTTPLILHLPETKVISPHGSAEDVGEQRITYAFKALECCGIEVEAGESLQQNCKEAILKSFREPSFGDIEGEVRDAMSESDRFEKIFKGKFEGWTEDRIVQLILDNLEIVRKKVTGVSWILRNPGRQWTSSINPIMEDPRAWYGDRYVSFRLGCEEVETCLRLMRRRPGVWKNLPHDVFGLIVRNVVWINSCPEEEQYDIQEDEL